jgi:hypothetical protein
MLLKVVPRCPDPALPIMYRALIRQAAAKMLARSTGSSWRARMRSSSAAGT